MSYKKNEWQTGDYVTAEKLNNVESGISELDTNKEDLNNKVLEINAACTDEQYPSAKAVWNLISKVPGFDPSGGDISLQDKTITENGVFEADEGYDGLGKVTVNVEMTPSWLDGMIEEGEGAIMRSNSITSINDDCFNHSSGESSFCGSIYGVNFPNCLSIGHYAFLHCSNLEEINFPKCQSIGRKAFSHTSSALTDVNLPALRYLEAGGFDNCYTQRISLGSYDHNLELWNNIGNCPNVTEITIKSKNQSNIHENNIGGVFSECTKLTDLYLYSVDAPFYFVHGSLEFGKTPLSTTGRIHVNSSFLSYYNENYGDMYNFIGEDVEV